MNSIHSTPSDGNPTGNASVTGPSPAELREAAEGKSTNSGSAAARMPLSRRRPEAGGLSGPTVKRYDLEGDAHKTVAHLRRILNQRVLPPDAVATLAENSLQFEWGE